MHLTTLYYIFGSALTVSLIMIPPIAKLSARFGGIDRPDDRKVHSGDTPRLGGIAIFCAFLFPVLFFVDINAQVKAFLSGAVLIFLTGLADDLTSLKPWHKLLGETAAATIAIVSGGLWVTTLGNPLGLGEIALGHFAIPFTIIAAVGLINAINMIDGLDGLAGGILAVACLAFAVISWQVGIIC